MSSNKRPSDGGDPANNKRLKSDTFTSASSQPALTGDALIAQKRAEISAKLAAMRKNALGGGPGPGSAPLPVPPVQQQHAVISSGPTPASKTDSSVTDDLTRRVAEAKRRVAEAQSKLAVKDNPYMSMPQTRKNRPMEPLPQGAGLKMAAHPLLLDTTPAVPQSKKDRYKPMQPKFASIKANTRNAPTPPPAPTPTSSASTPSSNPYSAAALDAPKDRAPRATFRFNPKGKYVALANTIRQEEQLDALKQRIAESARKAGLDGEFETLEKNIRRAPPPEAEWWDASLLPHKSYDDLEMNEGLQGLNIWNADSPITIYVQHPIPIPAPGEKNKVELKPLMLTTKEQKKLRKQRRQAELQDKRDRIVMGLIPPDPPKVRIANMMKVLTSDVVSDPTRLEQRIRKEVAARRTGHEKMNASRKLTEEQRKDKVEVKKVEQEKRGIWGAVFKIKILSDPAHQFKVRKNAEQRNLTGVCIFNPGFSLVYVEGAAKFIREYKKLMLTRMAWTEAARPRGAEEVEIANDADEDDGEKPKEVAQEAVAPKDPAAAAVSLENNRCFLVWEGQLRDRAFSAFRPRACPTDATAKEMLGEGLRGYWDLAKNWKPEEEEMF